ncbi:MAG: hypothetical protein R2877_01875 [Bdellovibrionota bacterium]
MALLAGSAEATEMKGYLNTGVWYLKTDAQSSPDYVSNDGYGQSYVQGNFALLNANTSLDFLKLNSPSSSTEINVHLKARGLYDLLDRTYTLSPSDKDRYQIDEANIELDFGKSNLWLGRHTIYEAGGLGVDGATALFDTSENFGVGFFGGLGNDPRNLTGYIGPTYRTTPFNADFYTGGVFTKMHTEKFQLDTSINTLLFKRKVDRSNLFAQMLWAANKTWTFSAIADIGFMGQKSLQRGLLGVTTHINPKVTNRLYLTQFRSLFYKQSDVSGIPVPSGLNPTFVVGTAVDTSEYYTARDEIQYRFNQNYIFTGMEYARRTFDDRNRFRYTLGYFDPMIFGSEYDFRIQTDIINNYISFNSSIDVVVGRDFANDQFRAEVGGTFYANERDLFENGTFVNSKGQVEKESTWRANFIFNATHAMSFFLNYAYYTEVDVFNLNQNIHTHEVYFSTNVRF